MYKVFLIPVLLLVCFSSLSQSFNVRIDGQIIGYDGSSEIIYTFSSSYLTPVYFKIKPDSAGRFTILKNIITPKFFDLIYIKNGIRHECKLFVQPNQNYSFISKGEKLGDWLVYSSPDIYSYIQKGDNSVASYQKSYGQMHFNTISNGITGAMFHSDWNLLHPETLLDTLHSRINSDKLNAFLKDNGIEMVYIAYEYDLHRQTWESFIKAYKLSGYHFISTKEFKTDFEKYAGEISGFPTYLIVDKGGNIVEPKAFLPSDGDKLISQILEKLKRDN